MDKNVRSLLVLAQKHGAGPGTENLKQAFHLMKSVADKQLANDGPEPFGLDLYVICAEIALEHGQPDLVRSCLKLYFIRSPPANQFLCRAYLCQARLLAPSTADNVEQLEKAIVYLLKAITLAKDNQRYHFLVYNASVLYWHFCRPFLKPHYRQHLARSLHQVVKALDDIDDKDYEWRAQLMIALIECHMDAGRKQDASHIASAAATFIKQNVPALYKTVFGLMVHHQLVDTEKFKKDIRTSAELNVFYRICRLKGALASQDSERDPVEEMRKILTMITGQSEEQPRKEKSLGRRSTTPEEGLTERKRGSPTRSRIRTPTPPGPRKSLLKGVDKKFSKKRTVDPKLQVPYLLLELGRLALTLNQPDISDQCIQLIKECADQVQDESFFLELEFLQCDQLVKSLKEKQESYHPNIVQLRVQAIKRCDEAIMNAIRLKVATVIQAGCVTQWNLCLPLLQSNLRHHCRRPLTNVANALESIQSLLIQLRCQVHMELAKCEEDQEQIAVAMEHLHKALSLDDGEVYRDRLQVALHRLELRAELYQTPERVEDQAAMVIEQARKADSGTMRMKRSLLVRAGQMLAPDAFLLVLDSENDTKEAGKGMMTPIKKLAAKAEQFKKSVCKAEGHLRRLGDENDKERAHLWGDLAKTARKQEVWDVCRVATRFCLLYDDGRWKNEPTIKETTKSQKSQEPEEGGETERPVSEATRERKSAEASFVIPDKEVPLYEKDLIRMMAEVNFINGEALIHLLRSENVQLGDKPVPPEDKSKRPKGYIIKKAEDDPDWLEYCDWIASLSEDALSCFLRAAELGIELGETWIVCSAAAYVWNYANHILANKRHNELVEPLQKLLESFKKVGHAGETVLLVDVCNALAIGYIQPWLPASESKHAVAPDQPADSDKDGPKRGGKAAPAAAAAAKGKPGQGITIPAEAMPDLKKAIEVCEYAMKVTNGDHPMDVVPIAVRYPLLQTWVASRQMTQQQISKTFGTDDENSTGQAPMTRAMVAVEMLKVNQNGIMEFRDCPTLQQAVEMVSVCSWTDHLVELQLWTELAFLALEAKNHPVVVTCATKALAFAEAGTHTGRKSDRHNLVLEQELLHYASCIFGQSLIKNTQGKNSVVRKAMQQFLDSARFAANAKNYDLVMTAARHYWNACLPLINQPMERELLKEPLTILLECIRDTTDKNMFKKEEAAAKKKLIYQLKEEEEDSTPRNPPSVKALPPVDGGESEAGDVNEDDLIGREKSTTSVIGGPDDDLTLRASLYGVLFQSYADKGEWDAGLKAMEQAINDMPRTNHRLLIFKHLVVVKAKIGLDVGMSIQKFKDEREDYVAHMWRRVALCSRDILEQLQAYQNAIEALSSPWTDWQKVDYLIEFGEWLFCNEFPVSDAMDQIDWAIDILLNMKYDDVKSLHSADTDEEDLDIEVQVGKSKKGAKGRRSAKSPPAAAGKTEKKGKKSEKQTAKAPHSAKKKGKDTEKPSTGSTEAGDTESEQANKEMVPTQKQAAIGVLPSNPSLTIDDLNHVTQLEGLFRSHIIQAQITGRSSAYYRDYCLMAYAFIVRMWQVSLSNAGPVMKEIVKEQAALGQDTKGSAKGKKKDVKEVEKKERPKHKGPLDHVPSNTEEWSTYDAPEEALEAFKHKLMASTGINDKTILKPTLTLYYLDILTTELRQLGYNHLVFPLLAVGDVITRDIIPDRPMNALIHLKAMETCIELNLSNGASFHNKLAQYRINEDEQAKVHQEMALWQERQQQVAREEFRIKEALSKYKRESQRVHMTERDREILSKLKEMEGKNKVSHLGHEIGALQIQETWAETAEVLIRNDIYQPARELLNEAHMAAKVFDNKALIAKVLCLLGKLSFLEAQYGQAVNFATQAQHVYDGDEMFWFNTTMLMIDSHLKDFNQKEKTKFGKARALLLNALNVFTHISASHPNKISINGFILAMLEAKLGSVQVKIVMSENDNLLKNKVMAAINSATKKMRSGYERLVELGYHHEALTVMKEQADLFTQLARLMPMNVDKHEHYVKAMNVLQKAVQLSSIILHDVITSTTIQEMKTVSYPAQREAAEVQLLYAELMLEMFDLHIMELRDEQLEMKRKGSVLRVVEELVKETPNYTEGEQEWNDAVKVIGDTMLTVLVEAHSLCTHIVELKARCMADIGKSLRLLGIQKGPDPPSQWRVQQIEALKALQLIEKTPPAADEEKQDAEGDEKEEDRAMSPSSPEFIKNSRTITEMKLALDLSHSFIAQATEVLTQAVHLALAKGLLASVSKAALELVECFGQFDSSMASQYLALHQSCQASLYLESLLKKALYDPQLSQQGALIHQRHNILENNTVTNANHGPVMKALLDTLTENSEAWRRLQVSTQHMDLVKEFPSNFTFIVMQHSPDRSKLYGCVLDKSKSAGAAGKAAPRNPAGQGSSNKAKVICMDTSAKQMDDLLSRFKWYRHEVMQTLLKKEYQRSQMAQRDKMMANLEENLRNTGVDATLLHEWEEDDRLLHGHFMELLTAMEAYLQPITAQLDQMLRPQSVTGSETTKTKPSKDDSSQEYIVLLIDQYLMELPLEALDCFQSYNIASLTREISLQMLHHKFRVEPFDEAAEKAKKEKEKLKPPSRIPGLRDASKKQAKIIPLERPVNPGFLPVDTHAFRYICDPHQDCSETEENKPVDVLNAIIEEHLQQFTPRWLGVSGDDYCPSQGEYEVYMLESSAFIFYGMERFLCHLPPHKVAALNLPDCHLVMLLDLAQTNKSFSRQAKVDVLKTADVLALEKPTEAAMLLSLTGIRCVCLNQWHCTLKENAERLQVLMKDLLAKGKSTGETARLMFVPNKRRDEEKIEEQALAEAEEAKKGGAGKTETKPAADDNNEEEAPVVEEPPLEMGRHWFNMICYGLPNLVVTQVGKP